MLAVMIDKKPQSRHLRRTTRHTGGLAYILMGHQEPLLEAVKNRAKARGIPYQRFIREALEQAVSHK